MATDNEPFGREWQEQNIRRANALTEKAMEANPDITPRELLQLHIGEIVKGMPALFAEIQAAKQSNFKEIG
ncbi:protein of unknown function [Aminobacter niigataensis]|nr:protein of unknown function [Aminobacter niigataensis]